MAAGGSSVYADLGFDDAVSDEVLRTLRRASAGGCRGQIAAACFQTDCATGDLSLVLYDVTTLLCRRRHNHFAGRVDR